LDYRAFELGEAGQVLKRHDFDAADDASGMERAHKYALNSWVEVCQLNRLVGTLEPPKGAA